MAAAQDMEFVLTNGMVLNVQLREIAGGMGARMEEVNAQGLRAEVERWKEQAEGCKEQVEVLDAWKERAEAARRGRWDEVSAMKRGMARLRAAVAGHARQMAGLEAAGMRADGRRGGRAARGGAGRIEEAEEGRGEDGAGHLQWASTEWRSCWPFCCPGRDWQRRRMEGGGARGAGYGGRSEKGRGWAEGESGRGGEEGRRRGDEGHGGAGAEGGGGRAEEQTA
ncbi:hypothetical protein CLOP_g21892 [Closterium sp. NIES-67]|nr:hypothetical protein CLOP_g21892 [Closterium sp. NIES-67]